MEIKVLDQGFVRLVDSMGSDAAIVQAARVSYGVGTKKTSEDEGLIRYLMRHRHSTPFEMVQFKFHIKAPIFVFRQWHRHRMWSYNEYSGRYSEMKDEFYVPEDEVITKQNPNNKQGGSSELVPYQVSEGQELESWSEEFENEQKDLRQNYMDKVVSGMRKELARINLPLSQYSEMYASVDLHNLFHFLKLRMDSHAQYEIRVYGDALAEIVKSVVPIAYKAFEDYVLNSASFSGLELKALHDLMLNVPEKVNLRDPIGIKDVAGQYISNKRELEEFISKLDRIISASK